MHAHRRLLLFAGEYYYDGDIAYFHMMLLRAKTSTNIYSRAIIAQLA